jgi:hypothetical protein
VELGETGIPRIRMGGKGEPEAKMALCLDHVKASAAVHSEHVVGFDSGMMMGLSLRLVIASMTVRENAPGRPETPMTAVGRMA